MPSPPAVPGCRRQYAPAPPRHGLPSVPRRPRHQRQLPAAQHRRQRALPAQGQRAALAAPVEKSPEEKKKKKKNTPTGQSRREARKSGEDGTQSRRDNWSFLIHSVTVRKMEGASPQEKGCFLTWQPPPSSSPLRRTGSANRCVRPPNEDEIHIIFFFLQTSFANIIWFIGGDVHFCAVPARPRDPTPWAPAPG